MDELGKPVLDRGRRKEEERTVAGCTWAIQARNSMTMVVDILCFGALISPTFSGDRHHCSSLPDWVTVLYSATTRDG